MKGATVLALSLLIGTALSGCWPFHRGPTPQQQFAEALGRGDTVRANRLWLEMSPEDRLKFSRGEGVRPAMSPEQLRQEVRKHLRASQAMPGQAQPPVESGMLHGGLRDLPSLAGPPRQPPSEPGNGQ